MHYSTIDGIDIATIGLEDLRTQVVSLDILTSAFITHFSLVDHPSSAQDVSLFSGTIRRHASVVFCSRDEQSTRRVSKGS